MTPKPTALHFVLTGALILAVAIVSGLAFFDQFWAVLAWVGVVIAVALLVGYGSVWLGRSARRR
jgi:hypothetical protein